MTSARILRIVASRSEVEDTAKAVGAVGTVVIMSILADRADWGWF